MVEQIGTGLKTASNNRLLVDANRDSMNDLRLDEKARARNYMK